MADDKSRIYVQRNLAATGRGPVETIDKKVDIFSKEGYFIYNSALPPNTSVIKSGFLYAYEVDEDAGMEYVKRYKIKNWDQIKK